MNDSMGYGWCMMVWWLRSAAFYLLFFFMAEISGYENTTNNQPYSVILKAMLKSRTYAILTF